MSRHCRVCLGGHDLDLRRSGGKIRLHWFEVLASRRVSHGRLCEPVVFTKAGWAICGPDDDIMIARNAEKTDWEVELGVVIGRRAKYVAETEAPSYVGGYYVINDRSERAFRLEGSGQWVIRKERRCIRSYRPLARNIGRGLRLPRSRHVADIVRTSLTTNLEKNLWAKLLIVLIQS